MKSTYRILFFIRKTRANNIFIFLISGKNTQNTFIKIKQIYLY